MQGCSKLDFSYFLKSGLWFWQTSGRRRGGRGQGAHSCFSDQLPANKPTLFNILNAFYLWCTLVFFKGVKVEHTLHKMLEKHAWMSAQKEVYKAKFSCKEKRGSNQQIITGASPLHPTISMHILHTVLCILPKGLTRRTCLTIKSLFNRPFFPSIYSMCYQQVTYSVNELMEG